ncbi:hypothetical protein ACIQF6_19010 [Kitasatospora sp. NPDC092948]|uniref:hypothetical protein n=1 Tax=Kitasatospora sp. NPDC092948 TaxID=3364088 RepID=UPI0038192DA4
MTPATPTTPDHTRAVRIPLRARAVIAAAALAGLVAFLWPFVVATQLPTPARPEATP